MTRYVALLRGINVGGTRAVPMVELRALCADAGFTDVATYIQSGNIVFGSGKSADTVATTIEAALLARFGFAVPTIVRSAAAWAVYAKGSAFPDAETERPKLLHLCLSARPPLAGAADALAARATGGERIAVVGDAIWVDFHQSVGNSKLTPAAFDKAAGSPVTARNWNSVQKLAAML